MKKLVFAAMLGICTIASATSSLTDVTARQRYPWNGKFDISYTASGVDEECQEQDLVALLKVFAVEQTTHVTNVADAAYLTGDATPSNGTHKIVWDMDAQGIFQGLVSTNFEVFVSIKTVPKSLNGVQLWEDGPYWATCNVGATRPEEYGYHFWWGDTVGYKRNAKNNGWISVQDGKAFLFSESNCPTYGKDVAELTSAGYVDAATNLVASHDAATAHCGAPWRMPTADEIAQLEAHCAATWITTNDVSGRLVTGKGDYADKCIFLPAAGYGADYEIVYPEEAGCFWSATAYAGDNSSWYFWFTEKYFRRDHSGMKRYNGQSVRAVFSAGGTLCGGSGVVRVDLRTGEVRTAASSEMLTYSTEWDGGETATIAVNGSSVFQGSGSGTYNWKPTKRGSYTLTHTVVTGNVPVVETACFGIDTIAALFDVTARQRYPWNGKFDIAYTVKGVDEECLSQDLVDSLKVFAVERTTHVTNVADAAYLTGDATPSNGTHKIVWDMDAQGVFQGLVSTNFEVFVTVNMVQKSPNGVQLWEDGPYWATNNVGATKPEEYGYYFSWGDTTGYIRNAKNDGWVSAKDGTAHSFSDCSTGFLSIDELKARGFLDASGHLVAKYDAATAYCGAPWRMPTGDEGSAMGSNCTITWTTVNGVAGLLVKGKGAYADKSIFLPAAGCGWSSELYEAASEGYYWTSLSGDRSAIDIFCCSDYLGCFSDFRFSGNSVRAVYVAGGTMRIGSGVVRADLRTGDVRTAASSEMLTYSTEWNGGETATIAVNGEPVFQGSGSGTYVWTPTWTGLYELTHTVVTGDVPVVETASFRILFGTPEKPWQIGATDEDTVVAWTNGLGTLLVEGAGLMKGFAADGSDVPWPSADIAVVDIAGTVSSIGKNAWYGLGADVTYNGLSSAAAKTMSDGFDASSEYGRTSFEDIQVENGRVQVSVAFETARSLTNDWTKVKLTADDVTVDSDGSVIISHDIGNDVQGFYIITPENGSAD